MRRFVAEAGERLRDEDPANMVLLRGFARLPSWPAFPDATGLRAAALADYSMYRGVARLIGMESLDPGHSMAEKIDRAREAWERFDFFFLHHKSTDAAGEDGDFERKMREIEKIDAALHAFRSFLHQHWSLRRGGVMCVGEHTRMHHESFVRGLFLRIKVRRSPVDIESTHDSVSTRGS